MGRLFGTDGVRGVAGSELTAELAFKLGMAVSEVLVCAESGRPSVIVGKDTRISGDMFEQAIAAGLTACGCDAVIVGVVPTPAVPYLIRKYKLAAGVMISASHNPSEYNGIKIFNREGYKLSDDIENEIEDIIIGNKPIVQATGEKIGKTVCVGGMISDYDGMIISAMSGSGGKCRLNKRIAFDLSNGSATATAKSIFTESNTYGCKTEFISDTPDGLNINLKCGSTHLAALSEYVTANHCDIGIAFDGDADRCLAVDENGREISGDAIIALLAIEMKKDGRLYDNTAVVTCMTNLGFHIMAKENGLNVRITTVGDRYVLEEMIKCGYNLGGEQSGHIIMTDYSTTGDGQLTAAMILSVMARYPDKKASELFGCVKMLPQVAINAAVPNEIKKTIAEDGDVRAKVKEIEEHLSGRGRVLLRPSGTEALVRIMLEGEDKSELEKMGREIYAVIRRKI